VDNFGPAFALGLGLPDLAVDENPASGREVGLLRARKTLAQGDFIIGSRHGQANNL
jgi:hypothetical protein